MKIETHNKINWVFGRTDGGDETGFNDPTTTMFRGNVPYFIAREPLQNIVDAGKRFPVKASFSQITIDILDVPKIEQLEKVFKACKEYFSDKIRYNEDCVKFFETAQKKIFKKGKTNLLKISDSNTSGMSPKDYNNFMLTVGNSSKETQKGGSFGLGKGAYFASSNLKTLFLSTMDENGQYLFAGKTRLVSFLNKDNEVMQGNGTFGVDKQKPVMDSKLIPDFFKRSEPGTDIYVVDFEQGEFWDSEIIKSVLVNFWLRILEKKLEVNVNGININYNNLNSLVYEYFQSVPLNNKHYQNPIPYYEAYTDPKKLVFEEKLSTIGKVKLHILIKESFPKHISYIRNTGMVIQKRFHPFPINYSGVFICDNEDGAEILRSMENPQHDDWNASHAKDGQPTQLARKVEKEIKLFIRKNLNSIMGSEEKKRFSIKGTEDFLSLPFNEEDDTEEYSSESDNIQGKNESAEKVGAEKKAELTSRIDDYYRIKPKVKTSKSEKKERNRKNKPKTKKNKKEGNNLHEIEIFQARSFAVEKNNSVDHVVVIKSMPNKKIFKTVVKVGAEDSLLSIPIENVKDKNRGIEYEVTGDTIKNITTDNKGSCVLIIKFKDNEKYSLSLTAYTNENN